MKRQQISMSWISVLRYLPHARAHLYLNYYYALYVIDRLPVKTEHPSFHLMAVILLWSYFNAQCPLLHYESRKMLPRGHTHRRASHSWIWWMYYARLLTLLWRAGAAMNYCSSCRQQRCISESASAGRSQAAMAMKSVDDSATWQIA